MRARPRARTVVVAVAMTLLAAGCGARFPEEASLQAGGEAATTGDTTADGVAAPGDPTATTVAGGVVPGAAGGTATTARGTAGTAKPGAAGGTATTAAGGAQASAIDPGPAPGITDTEIKIGYLLPLTGAAPVPSDFKKGANAYWNYVNDTQGGILVAGKKRKVRVVIEDTASDAQVGKDKAKQLIEEAKVFTILVLDRLENQQAIGAYLNGRKFPNIQVQTQANLGKDQTWTFGITIDHAVQGSLIADYFVKTLQGKKVAVVYENTPALSPGVNAFKAGVAKLGAEVVYAQAINGQDQNDFARESLALSQSGATATWLYMAPTPAAKLANQADAAGFKTTWFANSISWNFNLALTAAPKAFIGARAFSPWPPLSDPRTATYKAEYARQNGGEAADDLGLVGWGVGEVLAGGLQAVKGAIGQNSFREAFQNLQLKPQLFNPIAFGPGVRQGGNQVAIYKEQGGQWVLERDFTGQI